MKSREQRRRDLTLQIFAWAIAAGLFGSQNPFPETFNESFPVFVEMGEIIAEVAELQPTPTPTPTATPFECPLALPSRISLGDQVEVLANLHFRSSPELGSDNLLVSHLPGASLDIVGGPECYPYEDGAYIWWQVENAQGEIGWSAEGELTGNTYFLRPFGSDPVDLTVPSATPTLSPTPISSFTPTVTLSLTPTISNEIEASPTPTPTAVVETSTPTEEAQIASPTPTLIEDQYPLALPSKIAVGSRAETMTYLNLRKEPEISDANIIKVLVPGDVVEINGGPIYYPFEDTAYLWWEAQTVSGEHGWVTEGSKVWNFYYLEPLP